jgi:DNA-binding PadR family transcriptional regulator
MREPTFWILTSLAGGVKHGYALLKSVAALSDGAVSLKVPTLYAALDRLAKEGLIELDHEEVVDGRTRRYFALTRTGGQRLQEEVDRMDKSVRQARVQLRALAYPSAS